MKLESSYKTEAEIPAKVSGMYVEKDGKFVLDNIEGLVSKTELETFRANNIQAKKTQEELQTKLDTQINDSKSVEDGLNKQLKDINEKFSGIDLEEISKIKAKQKEIDDKKTMLMPDVETLIQERVKAANEASEGKIEKSIEGHTQELNKFKEVISLKQERLYKQKIVDSIGSISKDLGLLEGAAQDVTGRILKSFSLDENDEVVGKNPDGTIMYQKDAITPVTIKSYMTELKSNPLSKHLFIVSAGGGGALGGENTPTPKDTSKMSASELILQGLEKRNNT